MLKIDFRLLLFFVFVLICSVVNRLSGQTITSLNKKFGLTDADGSVILSPQYDSIFTSKNIPDFFILKNQNKFAYAYKCSRDSAGWIKNGKFKWIISASEFDSLQVSVIGITEPFYSAYVYAILKYKKNNLYGLLHAEIKTESGEGIFPSQGASVSQIGYIYKTGQLYERIFTNTQSNFFITFQQGRYGLFNPVLNEEYKPEFDTLPEFRYGEERKLYVRKNNKWGAVYLDQKTKTIVYNLPCQCRKIAEVHPGLFGCVASGDTILFRDSASGMQYMPVLNGKLLYFNPDSFKITINQYGFGRYEESIKPVTIEVYNISSAQISPSVSQVYYIDVKKNTVTPFNKSGAEYQIIQASENGLVEMAEKTNSSAKIKYSYYNIETGSFRFAYTINSDTKRSFENYVPKKCDRINEQSWLRFYSYSTSDEKQLGYYDFTEEKFSHRKPKCKKKKR